MATTELIVVDAETRRPVLDIDPLTVPTPARSYWTRTDVPGLPAFVNAAHIIQADSDRPVDIVWSGDVTRSFEGGCGPCARAGRSGFARLIDMVTDGETLMCPTC